MKTLYTTVATLVSVGLASAAITYAQPADIAIPMTEDSPAWDCRTMGNGICGPGQYQAGQYQDGKLIPWPHEYVPTWCKDICLGA